MDNGSIPTNDIRVQHIPESKDDDRTEIDAKSSIENDGDKEQNRKCQEIANKSENIPTDPQELSPKSGSENIPQEHFSLDALESTKIAVAQFAAAALANGTNESSSKDLTMLQSALFTLQHQQVFQMQLIEQLQYQLANTSTGKDKKRKISQTKVKKEGKEEIVEPEPAAAVEGNCLTAKSPEG